jgi:ABC-2 type transport system permease protein
MLKLFWFELRQCRNALISWTITLCFFSTIYIILYPNLPAEMREIDPQALALLQSIGMQTFGTFEGWILATEFNVLPLIVSLCGLFLGIGVLAADEDQGTLELLASLPISRLTLILIKTCAMAIAILTVVTIAGTIASLVFIGLQIDTTVTGFDLFWVILSHWILGFVFLSLSLFLGAYLPTRNAALGGSMAYLLVSFFGENLAGMAPVLDAYRPFFAFSYYKHVVEMLTGDVAWVDIAILMGAGILFLILALLSFHRRNLTVQAWPWQRSKIKQL